MFPDGRGGAYQNHERGGLKYWTATGEPLSDEDRVRLQKKIKQQMSERTAKTPRTKKRLSKRPSNI